MTAIEAVKYLDGVTSRISTCLGPNGPFGLTRADQANIQEALRVLRNVAEHFESQPLQRVSVNGQQQGTSAGVQREREPEA